MYLELFVFVRFIAFGVLLPLSAFVNRFLGFSICSKIAFFRQFAYLSIQLHKALNITALVFAILGFVSKWADLQELRFTSLHNVLGLVAVIMIIMIVLGTLLGQKQGKIAARYKGTGDLQATNGHRFFGIIFIIFGLFVTLTGIGKYYGSDSLRMILFIVYVLILAIIWIILEIFACGNKASMDKLAVNINSSKNEELPIVLETTNAEALESKPDIQNAPRTQQNETDGRATNDTVLR